MRISATVFVLGLTVFLFCILADRDRTFGPAPMWIAVPGLIGFVALVGGLVGHIVCSIWDIA